MNVLLQSSVQRSFGYLAFEVLNIVFRNKSFGGHNTRLFTCCAMNLTQLLKIQEQRAADTPNKYARKAFVRPNRIFISTRTSSAFTDKFLFPPVFFDVLVRRRL